MLTAEKGNEETKMTSIKESAMAYEPPTTKNICDLDLISTDVEIKTKTATKKDGEEFSYSYIEENGLEYRVPVSVLKQLKAQVEENPKLMAFKVKKTGSGMDTEYTVIPLQ